MKVTFDILHHSKINDPAVSKGYLVIVNVEDNDLKTFGHFYVDSNDRIEAMDTAWQRYKQQYARLEKS